MPVPALNRVRSVGIASAFVGAAVAAAAIGWTASSSTSSRPPSVAAFDRAPQVQDAATRFASLREYVPDPTSIRYAGRRQGLDWYFARGADSSACLISAETALRNLHVACTPPGDSDPTHLRMFGDTTTGLDISAAVVPDSYVSARLVSGPGRVDGPDRNLVVVQQTDDVVVELSAGDGQTRRLDLPDLRKHTPNPGAPGS